jgi:CubicO group peptidase (beta-lactamase class C family)
MTPGPISSRNSRMRIYLPFPKRSLRRSQRPLGWVLTALLFCTATSAQPVDPPIDKLNLPQLTKAASELERLHSLLVAVDGKILYAHVFKGPGLTQPVNIKSLSKTVLSAVVGAALDRGIIESVDQPITELIEVPEAASPRLSEVTVGNLLSMQAGLGRTSGPNYGEWVNSANWVDYALTRPFVAEPGGRMLYSTGSYHILSAALTEATNRSTLDLTREWLGNPLNIRIRPWTQDPQGIYFGGNNMYLSPQALLQIGELFRNGGLHESEQVISKDWVEMSWQPRGNSKYTGDGYGYGWFMTGLAGYDTYYGRGYGGQMLYVVPELAMTVVMTSDPTPPSSPYFMRELDGMLVDFVIPAVEERETEN